MCPPSVVTGADRIPPILVAPQQSAADQAWDAELLRIGGHVLQCSAWGRFKAQQGLRVIRDSGDGWMWQGLVQSAGPFPNRLPVPHLYLPYGPALAYPDRLQAAMRSAGGHASAAGCWWVRFEPVSSQPPSPGTVGARLHRDRQARHTWVLRIDVAETELRSGLSKGHRSRINSAQRKGLVVEHHTEPAALHELLGLLTETSKRASHSFSRHSDDYYRTLCEEFMPRGLATLYYARHEGRALAGALVFDFGETRYYTYAASANEGRSLSPAVPLVWQSILDARELGMRHFDFWGVAPPGAEGHPWAGLSEFKRSFGGHPVDYAGTWDLPVRRWRYAGCRLAEKLRR